MANTQEDKRVRQQTPEGQSLYEDFVHIYSSKLNKIGHEINRRLETLIAQKGDQDPHCLNDLMDSKVSYVKSSDDFIEFLRRTRTEDSQRELSAHELIRASVLSKVDLIIKDIEMLAMETKGPPHTYTEYKEAVSSETRTSRNAPPAPPSLGRHSLKSSSNASSVLTKQKMKHEAAKVRLKFMEKEAKLLRLKAEKEALHQKQQAEVEANLRLLQSERDVVEAEVELHVAQELMSEDEEIRSRALETEFRDAASAQQRTAQYVDSLNQECEEWPTPSRFTCTPRITDDTHEVTSASVTSSKGQHIYTIQHEIDNVINNFTQNTDRSQQGIYNHNMTESQCQGSPRPIHTFSHMPEMNTPSRFVSQAPGIQPFSTGVRADCPVSNTITSSFPATNALQHHSNTPLSQNIQSPHLGVQELTRYIMKKDLLLSRLSQFNDQPERYLVWKISFHNILIELQANPTEQLDLLCRWLGPTSSKQAASLRAANCHNEAQAVTKIWDRLDERYGAPELVEAALRQRLDSFPKVTQKDGCKLYELSDLLSEVEAVKGYDRYKNTLSYFDSPHGVNLVVQKLPPFIQRKWIDHASKVKKDTGCSYPPYSVFVQFIRGMATRQNDPSFKFEFNSETTKAPNKASNSSLSTRNQITLQTKKTEVTSSTCVLHGNEAKHLLRDCRIFHNKSLAERKDFIKKNGLCFKCCAGKHLAKQCTEQATCKKCCSSSHCTAFHEEAPVQQGLYGGEPISHESASVKGSNSVNSKCTQICGNVFGGKSCAKTVLVNIRKDGKVMKAYAIIDDQSNRSLARSEVFNFFQEHDREVEYIMSSCSGQESKIGRLGKDFTIESLDGEHSLKLCSMLECNDIPNARQEIPTPAVARYYRHLRDLEELIPEEDSTAEILLLIGRDVISAHHVLDQRIGRNQEPYAQKLRLGWVIIGETCLGAVHQPDVVTVNKTNVLRGGRETCFKPCPNDFEIMDSFDIKHSLEDRMLPISSDVFCHTKDDETTGLSQEDREFVEVMEKGFSKTPNGNWSAPLPFKGERSRLNNNREQALKRAKNLARNLERNPIKQQHFCQFMLNMLVNEHAEIAPPLQEGEECRYLPIFPVYNPKKPGKVRVVFDSSAKFDGHSLNDVLLTGPDVTNNLVGVLLKFRKERVAITADIEQMFFNFHVDEQHRNYLRFLWFEDNDPRKGLIDYRMRVHVFGNSPSPAVATIGLRKSACGHGKDVSSCDEVCDFVKNHFYVDDGLISTADEKSAVNLMQHTQQRLKQEGNLNLHKISSNSEEVLASFPQEDLAKDISEMEFHLSSSASVQRSLGLLWDIKTDTFQYRISSSEEKPCTKRGILSVVNSVFDPLGFVAPVLLGGRLILRNTIQTGKTDWDEPLPPNIDEEWKNWRKSVKDLEDLRIPRTYSDISLVKSERKELHVFSDASKEAIGAVAYLRLYDVNGSSTIGFILGKSKVAPAHGHTIPRLELCAAVLATEVANFIKKHLSVEFDSVSFYTDSQVVLGYLSNKSRRFYVYVGNRVDRILRSSTCTQWAYVPSALNPADCATRPMNANDLKNSSWLKGPQSFFDYQANEDTCVNLFDLIEPDNDVEIRPEVDVFKSGISQRLGTRRFDKFSSWSRLTLAIACLKCAADKIKRSSDPSPVNKDLPGRTGVDFQKEAELLILKEVQYEVYGKEINCLQDGRKLPKDSHILDLSPILDKNGLLRLGGRLSKSNLLSSEKNPVIIPGKHHIATLLVKHYHELVKHQGRHLTEGSIRSGGYWIVGGKRLINSVIHKCVLCKRLRGKMEHQKMAELPADRITPCPPFSYVGVDTFGPWSVVTRRTRGGQANSKRWAIMFSCLTTRAIHIEVVEELSSSSFINALRRFVSLRGPVKEFRSDRGTNFIGATEDLGITAINFEDESVNKYLTRNGSVWKFNPPHASHMSGSWERMIGLARRILDCMLLDGNTKALTHEVLCTFMAEVCAIVNARPLASVSSDPECPTILSPSALITQKLNTDIEPFENLSVKDIYRTQWRHVQVLAEKFWKKWNDQYIRNLQTRRKWQQERPNLQVGDVVLMKDQDVPRNQWPVAVVDKVFPSSDELVRKVLVRVIKDNKPVTYTRPITQLVFLFSCD